VIAAGVVQGYRQSTSRTRASHAARRDARHGARTISTELNTLWG
jgi:hypothetical protein